MRQYAIYTRATDENFKQKTAGANQELSFAVMVGSSKTHSHEAGTFKVTRRNADNQRVFELSFNGEVLKTVRFDEKLKTFQEV